MISTEQRQLRKQYIGSSDIAAICGKDPWRSAVDVFLSKTQEIDDKPNAAMGLGNMIEPALLEWASAELGKPLQRDAFKIARDGVFAANHDALVANSRQGVEAKTANLNHHDPRTLDEWGDEGTDDVPDHVVIQCQEQMHVSDLELVWVPALIGGRGRCMFKVERNDKLIQKLVARGLDFWQNHVLNKLPPPESVPSLEVVKSIRRQPDKIVQLTAPVVQAWIEAKAALKGAEDAAEAAEAVLLLHLGDAEAGDSPVGRVMYREENAGARIDAKLLKLDQPDIYEQYAKASTRRCLRLKAPKPAKV